MSETVIKYSQSTGVITGPDGAVVAHGWAGNGEGKDNPAFENVRAVGPLPRGLYRVGAWQTHPRLGPLAAPLEMIEGESYGRDDFWIHGPSKDPLHRGEESMGCIVIPREDRLKVQALNPTRVWVTA